MSDLIERQNAIKALQDVPVRSTTAKLLMIQAVEQLPSAEPQTEINTAYMRGKIDGINYCTEQLRKMRMEVDND